MSGLENLFKEKEFLDLIKKYSSELNSEKEIKYLVEKVNKYIYKNREKIFDSGDKEYPVVDVEYMSRRVKVIYGKEKVNAFRLKFDCANCVYFRKPRKCLGVVRCPLEENIDAFEEDRVTTNKSKKILADADESSNKCINELGERCPYSNDSGRCFGFCIKNILEEHRRKRKSDNSKHTDKNIDNKAVSAESIIGCDDNEYSSD